MKKIFGFLLLGLLSLPLFGCGTSVGIYADADKYLAGNQTYSENVSSLDIDWISGSVTLIEDETIEGVKIEESTNLTDEKELVHSYMNNGDLKIKFFASGHRRKWSTPFKKDLTITYKPGLENIRIELTSGSCKAASISSTNCDIDITSGSVKIDSLISEKVSTDATSGKIEIYKIETKEFTSDMTSGTLIADFISVEKASFNLTSGHVEMTLPEEGGIVKVSKTSGSIVAKRECSIDNNTYTFGSGNADINVSMTSGKIIIN